MLWLDHIFFGDGHGLASPYFDDRFYWLVDTKYHTRAARHGRLYHWFPGLGAQLSSFEWLAPPAGTRRRLGDRDYVVFSTQRRWLRVRVEWALVGLPKNADAALTLLREVESSLGKYTAS